MRESENAARQGGLHYGWVVCGGCTLLTMVTMGMVTNTGFAVYLPYIAASGSYSGVETALITTVRGVFSLLGMSFLPVYYAKLDTRLGAALSVLLSALTFVIYSNATGIFTYYMGSAVAGLANGLGSMVPVSIIISRWFREKKAMAIGIASCGTGLATFIVPAAVVGLVARFGLKSTMLIEAGAVALLAAVIAALLRNDPVAAGWGAYGTDTAGTAGTGKSFNADREMNVPELAVACGAIALLGAVCILGTSNISLLFTSQGYSGAEAAAAVSVMGIVLTGSKILYGRLTDLIGAYRSNAIFSFLLFAGLVIACTVRRTGIVIMYAATFLLGLGFPLALVGLSIWAGSFSTETNYGRTIKRFQISYQFGGLLFSAVPGYLADSMGDYVPAYIMLSILLIVTMVMIQALYRRFRVNSA